MQGLLETSEDFCLWDMNSVSSRPKLHQALELATLGSENNWTRSKPAETHQKPVENATSQKFLPFSVTHSLPAEPRNLSAGLSCPLKEDVNL